MPEPADSTSNSTVEREAADDERTEGLARLASEHPGLVFAGGLALGLLAGALMPKGTGGKIVKGATKIATAAGELGLVASRYARERSGDLAGEMASATESATAALQRGAARQSDLARKAGRRLAEEAINLVARRKN